MFDKVREALESLRGASPVQVGLSTPLRRDFAAVGAAQGVETPRRIIALDPSAVRRPAWVGAVVAVVAIALAWVCTFGPSNPKWVMAAPAAAMACLFFVGPLAAFFGVVGVWLTTPLAVVCCPTSRPWAIAHAVVAMNYGDPYGPQKVWTDDEILDLPCGKSLGTFACRSGSGDGARPGSSRTLALDDDAAQKLLRLRRPII